MNFIMDPSGVTGVLNIAGDLSVDRLRELKAALLTGMAQARQVTVELGPVTTVDIACLQVLYAAIRSFKLKNKTLLFRGEGMEAVLKAASRAGMILGTTGDMGR